MGTSTARLRAVSESLQRKVYYEPTLENELLRSLANYAGQSRRFLEDLIEAIHTHLRLLERYSRSSPTITVQVKRKVPRRRTDNPDATASASTPSNTEAGGDDEEEYDIVEEEREEVDRHVMVERRMTFDACLSRFAAERCLRHYISLLEQYERNSRSVNHAVIKFMYRVYMMPSCRPLFFKVSTLCVFSHVIQVLRPDDDADDAEAHKIITAILRAFFKRWETLPSMYFEVLFAKTDANVRYVFSGEQNDLSHPMGVSDALDAPIESSEAGEGNASVRPAAQQRSSAPLGGDDDDSANADAALPPRARKVRKPKEPKEPKPKKVKAPKPVREETDKQRIRRLRKEARLRAQQEGGDDSVDEDTLANALRPVFSQTAASEVVEKKVVNDDDDEEDAAKARTNSLAMLRQMRKTMQKAAESDDDNDEDDDKNESDEDKNDSDEDKSDSDDKNDDKSEQDDAEMSGDDDVAPLPVEERSSPIMKRTRRLLSDDDDEEEEEEKDSARHRRAALLSDDDDEEEKGEEREASPRAPQRRRTVLSDDEDEDM